MIWFCFHSELFYLIIIIKRASNQPDVCEGVIVYCGMEEASISYLTFVESPSSRTIGPFIVYFQQRLSLLIVIESGKAWAVPAPELRLKSCCQCHMDMQNSVSFERVFWQSSFDATLPGRLDLVLTARLYKVIHPYKITKENLLLVLKWSHLTGE